MSTADLERLVDERRFLERSLEDLEREHAAGELSDDDYESLKLRYETRASAVAGELEEISPEASSSAPDPHAPTPFEQLLRRRRGVIGWSALCCFVAAAVFLGLALAGVAPFSSSTASGSIPVATRIRTELAEAAALAENHDVIEAVAVYDRVLALDPHQPEALAEGGWLVRLAGISSRRPGLVRGGDREIAEAVAVAPRLAVPHAYLATALLEDDRRPAAAVAQLRAMLRDDPSDVLVESVRPVARRAYAALGEPLPARFG
jgi:hypothetical protein